MSIPSQLPKIAVIGGGASGFFFAIQLADLVPDCQVHIFEKSSRFLSKVRVSGGGRCNVTNATFQNNLLIEHYPRGKLFLKKIMEQFNVQNTMDWFKSKGVYLKIEGDKRIFPESNSSETIIDCFMTLAKNKQITLRPNVEVIKIEPLPYSFIVHTSNTNEEFHYVYVAIGGKVKMESYQWLKDLELKIEEPVPSLFTFNVPQNPFKGLEGVALPATVKIQKSKLQETGPLLITHWGLSGPVILRLSAWGAKETFERAYEFVAVLNFVPTQTQESVRSILMDKKKSSKLKTISSNREFNLPSRFWERLIDLAGVAVDMKWMNISHQKINRLTELLTNFPVEVHGKTTFKEEFVTCGGVSLEEVDNASMECIRWPKMYFGGEVLNIDGITGGFNFQNAWSTAYVAATNLAEKLNSSKAKREC